MTQIQMLSVGKLFLFSIFILWPCGGRVLESRSLVWCLWCWVTRCIMFYPFFFLREIGHCVALLCTSGSILLGWLRGLVCLIYLFSLLHVRCLTKIWREVSSFLKKDVCSILSLLHAQTSVSFFRVLRAGLVRGFDWFRLSFSLQVRRVSRRF